jgi:hypothetical protein
MHIGPGPSRREIRPDQRGGLSALQPRERPNPKFRQGTDAAITNGTLVAMHRASEEFRCHVKCLQIRGEVKMTQMHRLIACLALPVLLGYAPIGDAVAGTGTGHEASNHHRSVQSGSSHAASSPRHARGPEHGKGTYRSQLLHAKSEWRQARHSGNKPAAIARGG